VHAALLRDYLAGRIGSWRLRRELAALAGALEEPERALEPPRAPFELYPRHLIALCEAVAARELEPVALAHASRVLASSGWFHWSRLHPDGRVVEEVLVEWSRSSPVGLDAGAMPLFRDWLLTRRRPESLRAGR
jgi:hypothetical protein